MAGAEDVSLPEPCSGAEKEGDKRKVCFIHSQALLVSSDLNPRYTGRAQLVYSLIEAYGLLQHMRVVAPEKATQKQLQGFHSQEYIHFLETHSNQSDLEDEDEETAEEMGLGYDCPLFTGCYDYACEVGGAGLTSADLLLREEAEIVINWSGDGTTQKGWSPLDCTEPLALCVGRDVASGYCYCNDVVLAILRLQRRFSRILYVDIDVHHGDGVEEAFWHSPKVMTVSFHHFSPGFYPGQRHGGSGRYWQGSGEISLHQRSPTRGGPGPPVLLGVQWSDD
ncbi:Histone deacetylase 8 [Geodia barretti]|uniref:Histone deacetylase 8 n=1 Tax=Geodia barretti TaxID=519541 RepID=A0AA35WDH7_GEOBA|nr:Histone deacetylase 8 [Geodia barretti]